MNKTLRIITLMLIAVFLIAGTAMTAFADAGDGGEISGGDGGEISGDDGGGEISGGDGGDGGNIDPGIDPGVDPGYVDPGSGGDNGGGNEDPNIGGDSGSGYDPGYVDPNQSGGDSGYSQQTYIDDSPMYYGDASKYEYNTSGDNDRDAGSIDAPLYSAKVDTSDNIKAQKWENLEVPNDKSDVKLNSGSAEGDVSFADLKSNTSKGDNMKWLPYLGIVLIALAVLGILYFIIATISQSMANRKALLQTAGGYGDGYYPQQRGYRTDSGASRSSSRGYYPETRIASADDFKRENLSRTKARSRSDYSDGYNPSTRRGAKADTGEIRLPRRFK